MKALCDKGACGPRCAVVGPSVRTVVLAALALPFLVLQPLPELANTFQNNDTVVTMTLLGEERGKRHRNNNDWYSLSID